MLSAYKEAYIGKNIQLVLTSSTGDILESDQNLIAFEKGSSIFEAHPFFQSLNVIGDDIDEQVNFNCVHLTFNDTDIIVDVVFAKKEEGVLITLTDFTEHYNAYQMMAQARNESIINEELIVIKNNELEERERFKNSFIRNFSHELRNPLTSIIAITNIIGDTNLTSEQVKMLDFLKDSNMNLKLMLEDILSISMISSGKMKLESKEFNINKLLDLLEFTYTTKAKNQGLEFVLKVSNKIPEFVEGDRLRLFQILTNLLDNAVKYTEEGKVILNVQLNQKRANKVSLRFEVIDTGIGIAENNITSVFESFVQLNEAQNQNGAGLGLSIVKGLLAMKNSQIKLKSTSGEGSTFYFDLNLKFPLHPIENTLPSELNEHKKSSSNTKKKYKLLLIENDERIQTVLFKYLMASTNSFYIDLVNDGALVMQEVINSNYDIILMDVNLPNVSGDQLTRVIRDFPFKNIKNVPIIGITANVYDDDVKSYLDVGMNAVLSKPFEKDTLLNTIADFLE